MRQTMLAPYRSLADAGPDGATLHALLDAMDSERRLIDDLTAILRRQRSAVAADDLQAVDDSVFATHRILLTLGEARRRRRALSEMLGADAGPEVSRLDEVLGDRMTKPLRQARDNLQLAAVALSREVEINREVLREALAPAETPMPTLANPLAGRQPPDGSGPLQRGALLNRTG